MKPFIVTLTGPTCAGKSTLESRLVQAGFASVTSTTTRPLRAGEVDGKNYHFVNETRFTALQEESAMVESVTFGGYRYGVTKSEINRHASAGRPVVIVCEPNGRNQIIDFCTRNDWAYHTVYVGNPDRVIAERFLKRFLGELVEVGSLPRLADPVIERYAGRLEQMMTTERAWLVEAFFQDDSRSDAPYDQILWKFDEDNHGSVVQSLLDAFRQFKFESERLAS